METDTPTGTGAGEDNLLILAERNLERVIRDLDAICQELEARKDGATAEVRAAAVDLRKTIQSVFEERHRIGRFFDTGAGIGAEGALDLDTARNEIGRRLALLRKHSGTGGVSGKPE